MIDAAFGNWLAGFIDGEGCFAIARRGTERGVTRRVQGYRPTFVLSLRADDLPILTEIQERTGIGRIHARAHPKYPSQEYRSKPSVIWSVDRKVDLEWLVYFLDKYPLRAKKRRDYKVWRTAVAAHGLLYQGERDDRSRAIQARLQDCYTQLKAGRAYVEGVTE